MVRTKALFRRMKGAKHQPGLRLPSFLCLLFLWSILGAAGCKGPVIKDVPEELIGTWETSEPSYEGFSLEITPKWIIFANPSSMPSVNRIVEIKKYPDGESTIYRIKFKDDEQDIGFTISLFHSPQNGGMITYKFQPQIQWKKVSSEGPGAGSGGLDHG